MDAIIPLVDVMEKSVVKKGKVKEAEKEAFTSMSCNGQSLTDTTTKHDQTFSGMNMDFYGATC